MRTVFTLALSVLVVGVAGYALCRVLGRDPHVPSLLQSAATALVSTAAAFVPLALCRGAPQPTVAQAALVGTVVHLFGCATGATAMLLVQGLGVPAVAW